MEKLQCIYLAWKLTKPFQKHWYWILIIQNYFMLCCPMCLTSVNKLATKHDHHFYASKLDVQYRLHTRPTSYLHGILFVVPRALPVVPHFHLGFVMRGQYWHNTQLVVLPRVIWIVNTSVQYNTHDNSLFLKYVE